MEDEPADSEEKVQLEKAQSKNHLAYDFSK